jgi:hypothetical protein
MMVHMKSHAESESWPHHPGSHGIARRRVRRRRARAIQQGLSKVRLVTAGPIIGITAPATPLSLEFKPFEPEIIADGPRLPPR